MRPIPLLAFVCALCSTSPALADRTSDAKARFGEAARAYREARYAEAITLFLEANALEPHPELIFNVGQAYEKLGDVPSALRSYREYLRLQPHAADRVTVEASIRNLELRLSEKGIQQVSVFSSPSGATVLLDQREVGHTPWTGEIAPGRHIVVLRATGFPDTAKEFVLARDRAIDLDITLASTNDAGATQLVGAPSPPTQAAPDARPAGVSVSPWTFAALGVGAAGLAAGLGVELARQGAEDDARADLTQVGYAEKYDDMTSKQTTARVLVGVGAGFMVVGGALLYLDLRSPGAAAETRAGVACFDAGCSAFAAGRF